MILTAKRPILYRSKQYKIGEQLPADNKAMVDAWLEADSAEWKDEAKDAPAKIEPEAKAPKAKESEVEEPKAKTVAKKTAKKGAK